VDGVKIRKMVFRVDRGVVLLVLCMVTILYNPILAFSLLSIILYLTNSLLDNVPNAQSTPGSNPTIVSILRQRCKNLQRHE
jgi:hypothetical protein